MDVLKAKPWRWIVVNTSGGKDSQTALRVVLQECERAGIDKSRVVLSHQELPKEEWKGTLEIVQAHARFYNLRLEVSRYRSRDKKELSLLDYVRLRGKWPDNNNRYCTSDFKRGPGSRVITKLAQEAEGPVLNVFGFRAEESPARAKKQFYWPNARCTRLSRAVFDWLPIHNWTERQVWEDIKASGVPYHWAYDKGMPRLSCCFCIFAPRAALMIAGQANPELLDEYCAVEEEIGHTFQNGKPIADIRAALAAGAVVEEVKDGNWNM